jgi:hypothetical protein
MRTPHRCGRRMVCVFFSHQRRTLTETFSDIGRGRPRPERLTTSVGGAAQDPMSWYGTTSFTERYERGKAARVEEHHATDGWCKPPPTPWLEPKGNYALRQAEFSPDGRYVAYSSNENRKWEVYVRPFQGDGPQISSPITVAPSLYGPPITNFSTGMAIESLPLKS